MKVAPASIAGSFIVEPQAFPDARGYFLECWRADAYRAAGIVADFVQDNESCSCGGVIRGLHYQIGAAAQAKLVRVISGRVLDVAVDLRRGSPTFGRHMAVELSGDDRRQFFIPRGCAHGFAVLSDRAVFAYKCDNYYCPAAERGIRFDDPALGIDWRVPADRAILSPKDLAHPSFAAAELFA